MRTCIYLRKSRADEELEKINHGNTLNRHKDTLLKLSSDMKLDIIKIYEEIVSGESLSQRPEMLKLLDEVQENHFDAVLVMDVDRLGRGNMQEQGFILETFKQSNTKIITPRKTYDLNNEFDEEYSEFEAFMARKELKIINRRMQRGRLKSVEEGNYIGTYPPLGYRFEGQGRNRKLVIDEYEATIVKIIFEMYSEGVGGSKIASHLNMLGYKTKTGKNFYSHSIINIIKNPVYIGKLTWGKKRTFKGDLNKRRTVQLTPRDEWKLYDGKHTPIIDSSLYNMVLNQLENKTLPPSSKELVNPFAGLIFCSECKKPMMYRSYTTSMPHIHCYNEFCKKNKSSRFDYVEKEILKEIEMRLKKYSIHIPEAYNNDNVTNTITQINQIRSELTKLLKQKDSLHNLLEQGVYDIDTFIERSDIISNRIEALNIKLAELEKNKDTVKSLEDINTQISNVLDIYKISNDIKLKNQLLKTIIERIEYTKPKGSKAKDFILAIKFKI